MMKNIKKLVAGLLCMVMAVGILAGCGSDPVAEEFENFLNVEMVEVNANYEKLKAELANWEKYETDAEMLDSFNKVLIPNVEESLKLLSEIDVQTEEVKGIKAKYKDMLEVYKTGFTMLSDAMTKADEAAITTALTKLEEALTLLDEYNVALEELAAEKGLSVEY